MINQQLDYNSWCTANHYSSRCLKFTVDRLHIRGSHIHLNGQAADIRRLTGFCLSCAKAKFNKANLQSVLVLACLGFLFLHVSVCMCLAIMFCDASCICIAPTFSLENKSFVPYTGMCPCGVQLAHVGLSRQHMICLPTHFQTDRRHA